MMQTQVEQDLVVELQANHDAIITIVSPPRCSSTAFARVMWEHPAIRYYCHEPFEVTYYDGQGLAAVKAKLDTPLDLGALRVGVQEKVGTTLVIKEMPYQVGSNFPLLVRLATKPIIFLMRDPRLNIASRIAKKREGGGPVNFPLVETGWSLIVEQMAYCRAYDVPYLVVDASDFRNAPLQVFPQIFRAFGLSFKPKMVAWTPQHELELDNLGGAHSHLYRRVLASTGLEPATEPIPALEAFPEEQGMRDHVAACLALYQQLQADENRVVACDDVAAGKPSVGV